MGQLEDIFETGRNAFCMGKTQSKPTMSTKGKWQWMDDHGWVPYKPSVSNKIEAAFLSDGDPVTFTHGSKSYVIDHDDLIQKNKSTGFERKIRRVGKDGKPITTDKTTSSKPVHKKTTSAAKKKTSKKTSKAESKATSSGSTKPVITKLSFPINKSYSCPKKKQIDVKTLTNYEVLDDDSKSTVGDTCQICLCDLFDDDDDTSIVVKLSNCVGHAFHLTCIEQAFKYNQKCPSCSYAYLLQGSQPSGKMKVYLNKSMKCSGYSCGTIVVNYSFPNGTQSYMHPHPGKSYSGTYRTAYLPDDNEGKRVCKLLIRGFMHGLLFAVGDSVTTGQKNTTVWDGVHHKTSTSGGASCWGYPDKGYFTRVTNELASKGLFCEEFMAVEKKIHKKWLLKRQLSAEHKELKGQELTKEDILEMKLDPLKKHLTARGLKNTGSKKVLQQRLIEAI